MTNEFNNMMTTQNIQFEQNVSLSSGSASHTVLSILRNAKAIETECCFKPENNNDSFYKSQWKGVMFNNHEKTFALQKQK